MEKKVIGSEMKVPGSGSKGSGPTVPQNTNRKVKSTLNTEPYKPVQAQERARLLETVSSLTKSLYATSIDDNDAQQQQVPPQQQPQAQQQVQAVNAAASVNGELEAKATAGEQATAEGNKGNATGKPETPSGRNMDVDI